MIKSMENLFDGLTETKELDLNEILNNLIDGSRDVDLKTEILRPKELASLKVLSDFMNDYNLIQSNSVIKNFLNTYFRYMFSHNRLSRKEVVRAISYQMEIRAKNLSSKLTEKLP
jgi:hypothetical protein